MKICPKCARTYEDDVQSCSKDGVALNAILESPSEMTDEQVRKKRKQDWIFLAVGIPGFMLLLYWMYSLMAKLMK